LRQVTRIKYTNDVYEHWTLDFGTLTIKNAKFRTTSVPHTMCEYGDFST